MDQELEAYVARGQNPQLIPGIYNYCHHRCERCPFTMHCLSYREEHVGVRAEGERDLADHVEANVERAAALTHARCERDGLDLEKIEQQHADHAVDSDPLQIAAWRYSEEAYDIVEPLRNGAPCSAGNCVAPSATVSLGGLLKPGH